MAHAHLPTPAPPKRECQLECYLSTFGTIALLCCCCTARLHSGAATRPCIRAQLNHVPSQLFEALRSRLVRDHMCMVYMHGAVMLPTLILLEA